MQPVAEADRFKFLRGARRGIGIAGQFQRHRDILQRGHGRDQMERLEHDADLAAAKARQRVLVEGIEGVPLTTTSPLSGRSSPAITISSVDFPEPDGPIRPIASPGATRRLISLRI